MAIKTHHRQQLLQQIMENTAALYRMMGSSRDQFLASLGVNKPQVEILFLLSKQSMSVKSIAEKLHVTSSAVSQIVENLVKSDLLQRETSLTDRRGVVVSLSLEGKERFKMIKKAYMKRMEVILSTIADDQLESLRSITNQMIKATEEKK